MLVDLGCFWSELKITLRQQQIYTKFLALRGKSNVFFFFFYCLSTTVGTKQMFVE